jgi:hypothetical protein
VQGKFFVNATEAGNEVVFERSDGAFSGIAMVGSRGYKMGINFFGFHEVLEGVKTFVVKLLELWFQSRLAQFGMGGLVGTKDRLGTAGLHGFR